MHNKMDVLTLLKQEREENSLRNYHNFSHITLTADFFMTANIDDNVYMPEYEYLPEKDRYLQREYTWTLEQKQLLIKSKLIGNYVPPITLIKQYKDDGKVLYQVIDGKQRINAMRQFYNNEFPIYVKGVQIFFKDCRNFFTTSAFTFQANVFSEFDISDKISDEEKVKMANICSFSGTPQEVGFLEKFNKKNKNL